MSVYTATLPLRPKKRTRSWKNAGKRVHTVLSLHATKTLGAGEGGALLTHDAQVAQRMRCLINFGYDIESGLVVARGTNAKLESTLAALIEGGSNDLAALPAGNQVVE